MTATSNARIRSMDIRIIDMVFGREGGYVLDFSNRTFADFFLEELGVDIFDDRWDALARISHQVASEGVEMIKLRLAAQALYVFAALNASQGAQAYSTVRRAP